MKIEEAIRRIEDHMRVHRMEEERAVFITESLRMAIEVLKESQWIDAKEMPPKEEGEYIVMIQGSDKPTALYFTPDDGWWVSIEVMRKYTVTHWKPLPKAPEV